MQGEFEWSRNIENNLLGSFFYGYTTTLILGGIAATKFDDKKSLIMSMSAISITSLLLTPAAR